MLQWSVGRLVLLVVEDSVTLRESTTLNILSRDTDVVALGNERSKGQSLSSRPIDVLALVDGLDSVGENALQVAVNIELLGSRTNCGTDVLQGLLLNTSWWVWENLSGELLWRLEAVPGGCGPLLGG